MVSSMVVRSLRIVYVYKSTVGRKVKLLLPSYAKIIHIQSLVIGCLCLLSLDKCLSHPSTM